MKKIAPLMIISFLVLSACGGGKVDSSSSSSGEYSSDISSSERIDSNSGNISSSEFISSINSSSSEGESSSGSGSSISLTKLETPNPSVNTDGTKLVWNNIDNATAYKIFTSSPNWSSEDMEIAREQDFRYETVSTNEYLIPVEVRSSSFQFEVQALGDGTNYDDSDWSNPVPYCNDPGSLIQLDIPEFFVRDDGIAFVYSDYSVLVDLDGQQFIYTEAVELNDGETIKFKALGDNITYSDSDWTNPTTYHKHSLSKLATPVVIVNDEGLVSWQDVEHASNYHYKINTTEYAYENPFSLLDGESVSVKAIGDNVTYSDSDWSEPITYHAPQVDPIKLTTPVISFSSDTGKVNWNVIEGASSYIVTRLSTDWTDEQIEENREMPLYQSTTDTNEYIVPAEYRNNFWRFTVKAVGSSDYYINSDWSNIVNSAPFGEMNISFVNDNGLVTWESVSGAEHYYIDVYASSSNEFINQVTLDKEQTTYQMEIETYIVMSPNQNMSNPSNTLYYVSKDNGKWPAPRFTFKYEDGTWTLDFLSNDELVKDGVLLNDVDKVEFKVNGVEKELNAVLNNNDVISMCIKVKPYSHYLDSDVVVKTFKMCDEHHNIHTYPFVLPTEESSGHKSFTKCLDCGTILSGEIGSTEYREYYCDDLKYGQESRYFSEPLTHNEKHTWLYDSEGHFELSYCLNCQDYEVSSTKTPHTMEDGVCTVCGYDGEMIIPVDIEITTAYNGILIDATYDHVLTELEIEKAIDEFIILPLGNDNLYKDAFKQYLPTSYIVATQRDEKIRLEFEGEKLFPELDNAGYPQYVVIMRNGCIYENAHGSLNDTMVSRGLEINSNQEIAVGVTAPIGYTIDVDDWYWWVSREIKWTSYNEEVLTVDQFGNMTALKAGTALVKAKIPTRYGDYVSYGLITVKDEVLPHDFSSKENVTMTTKNPYQIDITFDPITSKDTLSYSSSDESVLIVDENGLVTALKAGTATVTVTASSIEDPLVINFTVNQYDVIEKTHLSYDYTDYYNHSSSRNNIPLEGDVNILVLPIKFSDSEPTYNYDLIRDDLEIAFFGSKEFNGYPTVKSFYEDESNGKLNINGVVADWYDSGRSVTKLVRDKSGSDSSEYFVSELALLAVQNYRDLSGSSLEQFDSDKDGYLDAVVLIYAYPNTNNDAHVFVRDSEEEYQDAYKSDLLWAEVWHLSSDTSPDINNPVLPSNFMFASFDFIYSNFGVFSYTHDNDDWIRDSVREDGIIYDKPQKEAADVVIEHDGYGNGFHRYVDTTTYIHEMGYMFGLVNYYDPNYGNLMTVTGGFNMQDWSIGGHDPYSRIALGWEDPYVVTDNCTIEINPSDVGGDIILLSNNGLDGNSPFNEYLLIELYTPTGLNGFESIYYDCNSWYLAPNEVGCRIWHVDSRLVDKDGNLIVNGVIGESDIVTHATTNTKGVGASGYEDFYQLVLIRKDATDSDVFPNGIYGKPFTKDNLFVTGDTFTMSDYKNAFVNPGLLDSGEELNWKITFDLVNEDRAVITFTKLV